MSLRNTYAWVVAAALTTVLPACVLAQQPAAAEAQPAATKASPSAPEKPPSAKERREAEKIYLEGAKALEHEHLDTAEKDFDTSVDLVPDNQQYLAAREIARQHHVTALVQAADKAKTLGHTEEVSADLRQAFEIDPNNPMVAQHLDEIVQDAAPDEPVTY